MPSHTKKPMIMVRIDDADKRLLERAAKLEDLPVSTWLRRLGLKEARRLLAKGEVRT